MCFLSQIQISPPLPIATTNQHCQRINCLLGVSTYVFFFVFLRVICFGTYRICFPFKQTSHCVRPFFCYSKIDPILVPSNLSPNTRMYCVFIVLKVSCTYHIFVLKKKVSKDWEIASGDVCLGAPSLCANEIQEFDTASVAVGGGVLTLTAEAVSMTTAGVTSAASGMLSTMGETHVCLIRVAPDRGGWLLIGVAPHRGGSL